MVRFAAPLIDRDKRKWPEAHETNALQPVTSIKEPLHEIRRRICFRCSQEEPQSL